MLAGVGITCGVTAAPMILRSAVVRVLSSGCARVRSTQMNMEKVNLTPGRKLLKPTSPISLVFSLFQQFKKEKIEFQTGGVRIQY